MMIRTIHSLKDEANAVQSMGDDALPVASAPQLLITSRPRGGISASSEVAPTPAETPKPSADIISIMDRISALAADGEKADQTISDTHDVPNIGGVLTRIHALFDEANDADPNVNLGPTDTSNNLVADKPAHTPVNKPADIAPVHNTAFTPEPHKLDNNNLEANEVDAAMQNIETAVRNAAPEGSEFANSQEAHILNTETGAGENKNDIAEASLPTDRLKDVIRKEVRSVIKAELPEAVRTIVRKTLQDEGYTPPQREKIRTRRFRNA